MRDIIIIGAGGHAAEIDEYITCNQRITGTRGYNILGFLDDNPENYSRYKFSAPLIGRVDNHNPIKGHGYIIAIASMQHRRLLIDRFESAGARFLSLIHCWAYVSDSAEIGEGTIIGPNANIGPNVKIGKYTLINSRCSLGHDTIVGEYNVISPNVCLSGFTEVGNENFFGINSATLPGIRVGDRNKISAGMILDQNVENDTVIFHRFKEKVIAVPKYK